MIQVFLDTNVIIDYLGNRTGFYDDAAVIMSLAINQKIELHAAAMSFATASYILSKKNNNDSIKTLIADFCKICKVVATDEDCVNYATLSDFEDFEDAMQYKCAQKAKADYIVTRNIKDFKAANIKVRTPEDFLEDFINQY